MKIVQINAVYKKLSTGTNVYELNEAFRKLGHCCIAAYSVGCVGDLEREWKIGSELDTKFHAILSRLVGLQGYFSPIATGKLLRRMDTLHPNVVVLNNLHANYIHLPMLLKYLAKKDIPTVVVLHDCWFYTGKCCYYTTAKCEKWKKRCSRCPAKKQYNSSWLFDFSRKMHKDREKLFRNIPRLGVIAVSDWLRNEAAQSPVFTNAKEITRIYNWIDTNQFAPVQTGLLRDNLGLNDKKIILAVAAMWENRKGLDTLLWMAERMGPDERLIMIGKTDQQLPDNVIHIDRTDSKAELAEYYSMADVFVQPSLEETFGKVTAEALACGTPVVCYNSTANPELVGEGCGAVVPAEDQEAMLNEVRNVLRRGKEHYTHSCRKFALDHFNMEKNCLQYMELFNRITVEK